MKPSKSIQSGAGWREGDEEEDGARRSFGGAHTSGRCVAAIAASVRLACIGRASPPRACFTHHQRDHAAGDAEGPACGDIAATAASISASARRCVDGLELGSDGLRGRHDHWHGHNREASPAKLTASLSPLAWRPPDRVKDTVARVASDNSSLRTTW